MPNKKDIDVISEVSQSKGVKVTSAEITVDDDVNSILAIFDRTGIADIASNICQMLIDVSYDNGATWVKWGGVTIAGGPYLDRTGTLVTETVYSVNLRKGTNRKIRASCEAFESTKVKIDLDQDTRKIKEKAK